MSDVPSDARAGAEDLVREASTQNSVAPAEMESLVDALEKDLETESETARIDEERFLKLEAQTQVLAEAVIAITDTPVTLAPAVRAVKAEMSGKDVK